MVPRRARILTGIAAAALAVAAMPSTASAAATPPQILLFSYSTGFRHDSIGPGIEALTALAAREGYALEVSEDPAVFSDSGLAGFDALILLDTTSADGAEWFTGAAGEALQRFVRSGHGIVGIHAAADSHYGWDWYGRMLGGVFDHHPPGTPEGALTVVDPDHPATRGLPATFRRVDEWYLFDWVAPDVTVLVTLDPASIGQPPGAPLPISWSHEFEGGRVFYTAMGHTSESFADPLFIEHLTGGLRWVLGLED